MAHKAGAGGPPSHYLTPWWKLRKPWPIDLHFEDGETERVLDRTMPLPELSVGTYGCTGAMCVASTFAEEGEVDARV
jgi:hypothetical protein